MGKKTIIIFERTLIEIIVNRLRKSKIESVSNYVLVEYDEQIIKELAHQLPEKYLNKLTYKHGDNLDKKSSSPIVGVYNSAIDRLCALFIQKKELVKKKEKSHYLYEIIIRRAKKNRISIDESNDPQVIINLALCTKECSWLKKLKEIHGNDLSEASTESIVGDYDNAINKLFILFKNYKEEKNVKCNGDFRPSTEDKKSNDLNSRIYSYIISYITKKIEREYPSIDISKITFKTINEALKKYCTENHLEIGELSKLSTLSLNNIVLIIVNSFIPDLETACSHLCTEKSNVTNIKNKIRKIKYSPIIDRVFNHKGAVIAKTSDRIELVESLLSTGISKDGRIVLNYAELEMVERYNNFLNNNCDGDESIDFFMIGKIVADVWNQLNRYVLNGEVSIKKFNPIYEDVFYKANKIFKNYGLIILDTERNRRIIDRFISKFLLDKIIYELPIESKIESLKKSHGKLKNSIPYEITIDDKINTNYYLFKIAYGEDLSKPVRDYKNWNKAYNRKLDRIIKKIAEGLFEFHSYFNPLDFKYITNFKYDFSLLELNKIFNGVNLYAKSDAEVIYTVIELNGMWNNQDFKDKLGMSIDEVRDRVLKILNSHIQTECNNPNIHMIYKICLNFLKERKVSYVKERVQ